ncbi:hypothetical protein [Nocardia salmonicida]|uniref:hypothetical protein n=1 Tax=Nocardia salmonicida TaxID=53431 RepID=UPI0037904C27
MARLRTGQGKNSIFDPYFWCFQCVECGRKGTRDYIPMGLREQEEWRAHGSYGSSLHSYTVVCRWQGPCDRRAKAKRAAREAAEAAQRAEEAAAGIVSTRDPVDLDAVQDQPPAAAERDAAAGQIGLW